MEHASDVYYFKACHSICKLANINIPACYQELEMNIYVNGIWPVRAIHRKTTD